MSTPYLSVIIPTWNRSLQLVEAVKSVLAQTVDSIEILVCDDGSTDDSRERIYGLGDCRVHWLPSKRIGRPGPVRNRGIIAAKGEWIAFLDSDDTWHTEKIEKQLQTVKSNGLGAVSTNAVRLLPYADHPKMPLLDYKKDKITFLDIINCNYVVCSSMMIHSAIIERTGGFPAGPEFKAIEDYSLWLKVASLTDIAYISDMLVTYKDDPTMSVRKGTNYKIGYLRKHVFGDYIKWSKKNNIFLGYKNELRLRLLWMQAALGLEPGSRLHFIR